MKIKHVVLTLAVVAAPAFAKGFTLSSPAIKANSTIGQDFALAAMGCTGKNISPELVWSGTPAGTKSFAVTIHDPDAPTGSGWWHWTVFNIPATVTSLPAGAGSTEPKGLPAGAIQGHTDFGTSGYGGPCPPAGDKPHHYHFTVYALKDMLPLDASAPAAMVGFYIHSNELGKATFTALYGR